MEDPWTRLFVSMQSFKADSQGRAAKVMLKDVIGFLENLKIVLGLSWWHSG